MMKSRLTKLEEKRSFKQAILFIFLTFVTIIILIFLGLPALVKLVTFLGDLKSSGQKIENVDTLPPPTPVLQPLPEATNSTTITITGFGEEGTTIKLFLNGEIAKEVVTGKDGSFVFDKINLSSNENKIKTKAADASGNESQFSSESVVVFDNQPPDLNILSPNDQDKFFDKDREITVKGESEPNLDILVNDRLAYTDSEGKFSSLIRLNEGENTIKVQAKDKAGNETTKEVKVTYSP